jgi:hypothetical protein
VQDDIGVYKVNELLVSLTDPKAQKRNFYLLLQVSKQCTINEEEKGSFSVEVFSY